MRASLSDLSYYLSEHQTMMMVSSHASNRTLGGKMMETHEHCISSIPYRGDTVTCSAYLPNYYFLRFGNLGGKAVAEEASVGRRTPSRRV